MTTILEASGQVAENATTARPRVTLTDAGSGAASGASSPADRDDRWLDLLLSRPSRRLVRNVDTEFAVLHAGNTSLPVTINDAQYDNSYVCSPYTTYVRYPRSELEKIDGRVTRTALRALLGTVGPLLRSGGINRVACVNNWLLSTNLYPAIRPELVPEMTQLLMERFPRHAIALRSLNRETNSELCERLSSAGYLLVPSRQVYLLDVLTADYLRTPDVRKDRRLLETTPYLVVPHDQLEAGDVPRIEHLYRLLYIDKHSPHNPQFTVELVEEFRSRRLLAMWGLRSPCGRLDGIIGAFDRGGVMTVPLIGYDTGLPLQLGLYRMLTAIGMAEAARRGLLYNLSGGAAHFKRMRGGRPCIEYTAIYCRHLRWRRRAGWRTLALLLERVGVPILKKHQL